MFGFKNTRKINTEKEKVDDFLTRGVEKIFPSKEFLEKKMLSGERQTIYLGIDPTGPTLHLGHAIILKKLRDFQRLGHQIILLIGDFTGMIGDPTDKTATRKKLTRSEVLENSKLYKKQASLFIDFSGSNKAVLKYNSKWLGKMTFGDVLELSSKMTVEQMLKRDMFEKRMTDNKPIYIHEFMYPLMQGYDSVVMNVDGEIGGNDQTFNMLTGRDLMKQILNKEKFVITMKLLEDTNGKKMGKTEGNMITLKDSPEDIFGKIMSWTDGMILPGFELCTDVDLKEIERIKSELSSGANPKDLKVRLAKEVVKIYYSEQEAKKAEQNFTNTFKKGMLPEGVEEIMIESGKKLSDILTENGIIKSKTEFRRLVSEKAIKEMVGGEEKIIEDFDLQIQKEIDLKVGKRRFVKIKVK